MKPTSLYLPKEHSVQYVNLIKENHNKLCTRAVRFVMNHPAVGIRSPKTRENIKIKTDNIKKIICLARASK